MKVGQDRSRCGFLLEIKMQGWIRIYRKIWESEIWDDEEPFDRRSAFIDLLLMANHADKKVIFNGKIIQIKAGQRITSIRNLADRWHWSTNRVLRYLKLLEDLGMITRECDKQKTLLTIVNYGFYQDCRNSDGDSDGDSDEYTNGDTNGDSDGDKTRMIKNEKNEKKDNVKKSAQHILDLYHQLCPSLPKVVKLTPGRIKATNARLKEYSEDDIKNAFIKAEQSTFLCGEKKDWKASFDWIMKPNNMPKILEGNYDDAEKPAEKQEGYKKQQYDFATLKKSIME